MEIARVQPAPLCFVLMPFGRKTDAQGRTVDFDAVYGSLIAPAVREAGMEPIRADEEKIGGAIHKPMFERLMLCHYAVADITGANPNVFYELGIRHALRPRSTVMLFAEGTIPPFDVALVRGIPYKIGPSGEPADKEAIAPRITERLKECRENPHDDSPIYQLIDDLPRWEVDHMKTDVFREAVEYSTKYKDRLAAAVKAGRQELLKVAAEPIFSNLSEVETGIVVDLLLSMRDVEAFPEMIALVERMPPPLSRAKMMREQLGFALNRVGRFDEAERVLKQVLAEFGPSSETNGLLGRIYKDRWREAKQARRFEARSLLRRAIETYTQGFEADVRDTFPGVNAVTLMELEDEPSKLQQELLPVIRYSAARRAKTNGDYWDHATLFELAVLSRDRDSANEHLANALILAKTPWNLKSTAGNIGLIREAREKRGEEVAWICELEQALSDKIRDLEAPNPTAPEA